MSAPGDILEIRCNEERVRFSSDLLERYNVAGPRYTSYPTAPEWSEAFGAGDLVEVLEAADRSGPLSLYMHLPFCESLCLFCGCNVVIQKNHAGTKPYLDRLHREIDAIGRHLSPGRPVRQFHWGGGTPTYLSPGELEELFAHVRERFVFAPDAEVGIEIDPRVTTSEHVRTLRRIGFNRVSMGVQDFDLKVQETIHRIQPYESTRELFDLCRAEGYSSINVDLIYGLPHQTVPSFSKTVEQVIDIGFDRVAMYSYAHVPWLKKQQGSFARFIPEGRDKFRLFEAGMEGFTGGGYRFVGFDHFARPSDELCVAQERRTLTRNFQGYSTCGGTDLLGLGVSAISSIGRAYSQSVRDLPTYYARIDAGELPTLRGLRLTDDDVLRREVITRILCHCRLRKSEIEAQFGVEFDRVFASELESLAGLERDGLVRLGDDELEVTLLGRIFLRVVGMVFDTYLRRRDPNQRLFSKTV